jgi:hypothetical protein
MLLHMRTTINLDDHLFREAKAVAAREGRTLTDLFEEGLRGALAARAAPRHEPPGPELPVFTPKPGLEGLQPGFTWEDLAHESGEFEPADAPA